MMTVAIPCTKSTQFITEYLYFLTSLSIISWCFPSSAIGLSSTMDRTNWIFLHYLQDDKIPSHHPKVTNLFEMKSCIWA